MGLEGDLQATEEMLCAMALKSAKSANGRQTHHT
jgi:hypothetical protein